MSKAPAMPMMIDAYIGDTTHLTTEEHGAYLLLLFAMWRRDGSVPDNNKDIARIVGLTVAKWLKVRARLSDKLICNGHTITQKNLQKIWKNTQEKIEKNKQNGALGGRPKSHEINDKAKANGFVSLNPNQSIPEPEPDNKKEIDKSISKEKRKSRLKPDWSLTDQDWQYAASKGLQQKEIENEENKFREYYLSSGSTWLDWGIVWKRWVGRCVERGSNQAGRPDTSRNGSSSGGLSGAAVRLAKELSISGSAG
jgi:uncharacterized protein YdaU (DUF1376 family)